MIVVFIFFACHPVLFMIFIEQNQKTVFSKTDHEIISLQAGFQLTGQCFHFAIQTTEALVSQIFAQDTLPWI